MQERAEQVAATRQRIVDATVRLHTTVGPSRTTVSAIAEQAGVTRLTVYRHFPDREALFEACTAQWAREHPPPDPAAWRAIRDVETRAYRGLRELYGWYGEHGLALLALYRDPEVMPESVRQGSRDQFNQFAEALVTGSGIRGHARRRLRAAAGHAVDIRTWYLPRGRAGTSDGRSGGPRGLPARRGGRPQEPIRGLVIGRTAASSPWSCAGPRPLPPAPALGTGRWAGSSDQARVPGTSASDRGTPTPHPSPAATGSPSPVPAELPRTRTCSSCRTTSAGTADHGDGRARGLRRARSSAPAGTHGQHRARADAGEIGLVLLACAVLVAVFAPVTMHLYRTRA